MSRRRSIPAAFMRGGTSKALMFLARDLPAAREGWAPIFLSALGSPDLYGRQLDGMGGGVSSLSKICVVGAPSRADADVDYTFVQVLVTEPRVDYRGNCGNMLSAVGPFAVDEGLVKAQGDCATVRIHNTNTGKLIHARFPIEHGKACEYGELAIPGVSGTGAPIRLDFVSPGGATTGKLLPTGEVSEWLTLPGLSAPLRVSLVDAGNACVFVRASDLGLSGTELPDALERDAALMQKLLAIRAAASVHMGIAPTEDDARKIAAIPYLALVSPPAISTTLSGETLQLSQMDLQARVIASGQPHRALPLTVSLCTAVAARISGSVVHECCANAPPGALRLGMPSGVLTVGAEVAHSSLGWIASSGSFYRTARRLFDGRVYV